MLSQDKDFGGVVLDLTEIQEQRAVYKEICAYMDARLDELRSKGDDLKETVSESSVRKGRIAEIKHFLKASKTRSMNLKHKRKVNYN